MLECLEDVSLFSISFFAFGFLLGWGFFLFFYAAFSEQSVADALSVFEDLTDHETLMVIVGMFELDHKRCVLYDVTGVVVIILDGHHLLLELANVHS